MTEIDTQSPTPNATLKWTRVACNLCGADDARLYHRETLPYFDRLVTFTIVRCRECGLVYTNPRLADDNAVYLEGTDEDTGVFERHAHVKAPVFNDALRQLTRIMPADTSPPPALLDIGCNSGHFLDRARQHGYRVAGLEPASVPAQYARTRFGLEIFPTDVLDADLPPDAFDIITAWDVIEHVPDPRAVLRRCVQWLRPGGVMALRLPEATWQKIKAVVYHNILSGRRAAFAPTMHLTFFTEKTFRELARQEQLEIIHCRTTHAEANAENAVLNSLKLITNMAARASEKIGARFPGNLEIYCRKVPS